MWDVRYRPLRFSDVMGQGGTIQVLRARLRNGTALDTSYIFSGGHGQGKTSLARILARGLLCQDLGEDGEPCNECDNCQAILTETSMAFAELDAASRGTIDNVRKIVDNLVFVVPGAPKRVYIFDEVHRMSRDSQDVLLKPLEDKKLVGIFCTTEPAKIRGTIRSRCEEYPVRKIAREEILQRAQSILQQEGVEYEDDALLTIIDHSGGHVRDVINRLEMIAQLGKVDLTTVREHLHLSLVSTYYEILLALGESSKAVTMVEEACDRVGADDVSAGLAEAAMDAYRLAHGIFAEFMHVDRELASKVHGLYGDRVIELAEYFLRTPRATKVGLVCDVIRCARGVPAATRQAQSTAPPVVVQATVATNPAPAPEPAEKAPESPQEASAAPEPPEPPPEPATPPEGSTESAKPSSGGNGKCRLDGKGNLGSGDVQALTGMDIDAIPDGHPRGAHDDKESTKFEGKKGKHPAGQPLTPEQWNREFALTWTQRGTNGDNGGG